MKRSLSLLITASSMILLSSCNVVRMTGTTHSSNVGRQLLDLNEAKEKGLISEEEYEHLKSKILDAWVEKEPVQ